MIVQARKIFLFFSLILVFTACQDEFDETSPFDTDKVITPGSEVANLILRTSLLDGSVDNILDSSSCVTLLFPVAALVNGEEITIHTQDDLKYVERILDESDGDNDGVQLVFPVTIVLPDYTQQIINDQESLEELTEECNQSGDDEDIECIDFNYPITITSYNTTSQSQNVVTLQNDNELYDFFSQFEDDDLASIQFPIVLTSASGDDITIGNNSDLMNALEQADSNCDEDDDNDYNDDDVDDSALVNILTTGEWKITYFLKEQEKTEDFDNLTFTFAADGTLSANDGNNSEQGTWSTYGDNGSLELELVIGENTELEEISEDWPVKEYSTTIVRLEKENEDDESTTHYILIFTKQ